jgi:molecular chaperone DnaK (HSP70)
MPAGIPQIQVQFLVDANGILNVSAVERRSGKRASIQVAPRYGLSREEVDRLERESLQHAREDMHAHRIIDLAVNAQLDIKWITEAMERVDGPAATSPTEAAQQALPALEPAYRDDLLGRIATLKGFIERARSSPEAVDADAFHRAKEDLDKASVRLHEISIARSLSDR